MVGIRCERLRCVCDKLKAEDLLREFLRWWDMFCIQVCANAMRYAQNTHIRQQRRTVSFVCEYYDRYYEKYFNEEPADAATADAASRKNNENSSVDKVCRETVLVTMPLRNPARRSCCQCGGTSLFCTQTCRNRFLQQPSC